MVNALLFVVGLCFGAAIGLTIPAPPIVDSAPPDCIQIGEELRTERQPSRTIVTVVPIVACGYFPPPREAAKDEPPST